MPPVKVELRNGMILKWALERNFIIIFFFLNLTLKRDYFEVDPRMEFSEVSIDLRKPLFLYVIYEIKEFNWIILKSTLEQDFVEVPKIKITQNRTQNIKSASLKRKERRTC